MSENQRFNYFQRTKILNEIHRLSDEDFAWLLTKLQDARRFEDLDTRPIQGTLYQFRGIRGFFSNSVFIIRRFGKNLIHNFREQYFIAERLYEKPSLYIQFSPIYDIISPEFLQLHIIPSLVALDSIQQIINGLKLQPHQPIEVVKLEKGSLTGEIKNGLEAAQIASDMLNEDKKQDEKELRKATVKAKNLENRISEQQIRQHAKTADLEADLRIQKLKNELIEQELKIELLEQQVIEGYYAIAERIIRKYTATPFDEIPDEQRLEWMSKLVVAIRMYRQGGHNIELITD